MRVKKFNCRPSLNKKISIPTRKDLIPIVNELKPVVVDKVFTVPELMETIGVFLGTRFRVDVTHGMAQEVDPNDIDLNAYYDSGLDEAGETSIELYLITNPLDEVIILNDKEFDEVAKRIVDSITHEIIHMKQCRSRDFLELENKFAFVDIEDEQLESQMYLANPDELDAYAHNIAEELLECPNCRSILENPAGTKLRESVNLWAYLQTFEKDLSHPVLKKLLKKVYKNISTRLK